MASTCSARRVTVGFGDIRLELESELCHRKHSTMGWRYFNVAEDVWPRSERQVDHQDDETGHNNHRGRGFAPGAADL